MNKVQVTFTVLFDGVFYIGIIEKIMDNELTVSKHLFGKEPNEMEVLNFILKKYSNLVFTKPIEINKKEKSKINPKRLQRDVKKQMIKSISTKSQLALKINQEQNKVLKKQITKEQKEELLKSKFELKQKKKQEKHKGR